TIRALAVTTAKRAAFDPSIPTIAETVPGFEAQSWNGIVMRAGTPAAIMDKVQLDFSRAVRQPEAMKLLAGILMEPVGNAPAEFAEFIKADQDRWDRVVKALNLNPTQK